MDFRKASLLVPIILIVFTSGCTIPGIGPICIPFLPCDNVVEFEDDVVVIKSLDALPKTVSPGQQIRLVAYIQNVGKEPVPQKEGQGKLEKIPADKQNIVIDLYDYCEGLFEVDVNCGDGQRINPHKCEITNLLPQQIKEVDWTLRAGSKEQVPLKTECDLKVSVTYPYKTTSLTQITFIDYQWMQKQLNDGTFRTRESYIVSGYGPVKPRITVEDQQPIPVEQGIPGRTVIALRVKNSGNGYLCRPAGTIEGDTKTTGIICDSKIPKENIEIEGIVDSGDDTKLYYSSAQDSTCAFPNSRLKEDVTLIKKESPPLLCDIEMRENVNLPKETTKHVTTEVEYLYEFRKEMKVIIEPKT